MRDDLRAELVVDALKWRSGARQPRPVWCTTPTAAASTPAGRSAAPCATPGSCKAWAAAATPTTTPRPRASCQRSRPSSSTAALADPRRRPPSDLRLHRRLVQPAPPPLSPRQKPRRIRENHHQGGQCRLTEPVHQSGSIPLGRRGALVRRCQEGSGVVGWGRHRAVVCDVNRCCLAPIWDGSLPTCDGSTGRLAGVSASSLPTLYKARGLSTEQPVCAICVERTRGRTQKVTLGYGVVVWLCGGHASRDFQIERSGRDFVRTLSGVWQANGCLTQARSRALHGHLASSERPTPKTAAGELCVAGASPPGGGRLPRRATPPRPSRLDPHHLRHLPSPPTQPTHPRTLGRTTPLAHRPTAALAT